MTNYIVIAREDVNAIIEQLREININLAKIARYIKQLENMVAS